MQAYFETDDGQKICYTIHRTGKKPMVLLHGWGGTQLALNLLVDQLQGDYTIITYDHRGFGKSDRPMKGYTVDRLVLDLKELLEHLDLHDVVLVGWSMGGVVSTFYLDTYGYDRVSRLVLIDNNVQILSDEHYPYGFYDGTYTAKECMEDLEKMHRDIRLFAQEMPEKGNMVLNKDPKLVEAYVEKVCGQNPDSVACTAMWVAVCMLSLEEPYKRLNLPVLFCHGGRSTYCGPKAVEYVKTLIKGVEVAEFPDSSHFIPIEEPEKIAAVIDDFSK